VWRWWRWWQRRWFWWRRTRWSRYSATTQVTIEDEEEEIELEKRLEIGDVKCKEDNMTEQAISYLENELLNMEFPCEDLDHQGILDEIVEILCNEDAQGNEGLEGSDGSITLSDAEAAVGAYDYIRQANNLSSKCPIYACIWNEMINGGLGTELICNLSNTFEGSNSAGNLTIYATDFSSQGMSSTATGATFLHEENNEIGIAINSGNCNDEGENLVAAFETLQHEFVHAQLNHTLLSLGYEGDYDTMADAFFELVGHQYGENPTELQHEFMLDYFLVPMVNSLIEMNGGVGTYSYFVGLVLSGFPGEVLEAAGYNVDDFLDFAEIARDFIENNSNINQTLIDCGN